MTFPSDGRRVRRLLGNLFVSLLFCASARANSSFFVPYITQNPWKTVLIATNSTPEPQTIIATYFTPDVLAAVKQTYVIPPNSSLRLDLTAAAPSAFSALVETDGVSGLGLKAEFVLGGTAVTGLQLPRVVSQSITLDVPVIGTVAWTGVAIANVGDVPDEVLISAYGKNGLLLATTKKSVPLHGGVVQLVSELFPDIDSMAYLRIGGANRLLGMTVSQTHGGSFLSYPADTGPPRVLDPDPSLTYFLVGYPRFGERTSETYVIGLSNPAHIAEARGILADPSIRKKIVEGSIARGHGGHNRNMTEPGGPAYSWHIEQFKGFAEFAAEVCDGRPSDVEFDATYWIENIGQICFWTPTIVRELTFEEVKIGALGARLAAE